MCLRKCKRRVFSEVRFCGRGIQLPSLFVIDIEIACVILVSPNIQGIFLDECDVSWFSVIHAFTRISSEDVFSDMVG
jgi:hypothetical protein